MNNFKKIYKIIKKYDSIVIARHQRVDPDAMASELALKEIILNTFPKKKVYAIGVGASRFKYMGNLDKLDHVDITKSLLIVLDTPDKKRVDCEYIDDFEYKVKIDHHPFVEEFCDFEFYDSAYSSTCEIILELVYKTKLKLNENSSKLLFQGIVSDTNRFTTINTSFKTFDLVHKLIKDTNISFTSLYDNLYTRPLKEIKFQGYIAQNLSLTNNGLAYIKIEDKELKDFDVDSACPGNMINNFNYIDEILVWTFITHDVKNNIYRITIRSRGPKINDIASLFNGGGHDRASGARVKTIEEVDDLLNKLDEACISYRGEKNENK